LNIKKQLNKNLGIENEKLQIDIAGTAVYVKEFEVLI